MASLRTGAGPTPRPSHPSGLSPRPKVISHRRPSSLPVVHWRQSSPNRGISSEWRSFDSCAVFLGGGCERSRLKAESCPSALRVGPGHFLTVRRPATVVGRDHGRGG